MRAKMNDAIYRLIRTHYRDLEGYVSAGMESGKDPSKIFMNANENPFELPGLEGYNRYPEPQPPALLDAYARLYGTGTGNIVMTRGADEAIVILVKLFCEPHRDAILITPPTFGMYPVDARAMPADVIEVPLIRKDGTFKLDSENIIKAVRNSGGRVKLVFICSPNNPTGNAFDPAEIERLCKTLEGQAIVLLDETYAEFSTQGSMTSRLPDLPNMVILRTLSKSYAFAGMRMGCLLSGDTDFIALVRSKCLDAYPLPKASIEAALKIMTPEMLTLAAENRKKLLAERDRLHAGFESCPLVRRIYPSDANFLFIEMEKAGAFVSFCAERKIILRDFSSKPGTENCIRISPGLPHENNLLLRLLRDFEKEA
jgi:histidinol-phosphate aminotransferase